MAKTLGPDDFYGWGTDVLADNGGSIEAPTYSGNDFFGWGSDVLDPLPMQPPLSVPFVGTPSGGSPMPTPPQLSVPFVNQPTNRDPLTEVLEGRGGPDWQVPEMDPASTFQPRTDTLTADGIPFPRHFWPGSEVYKSAAHERRRLQQNKDAAFPFSSEDWNYYGGSLREGMAYEPPKYDGSVPLARLMKPVANDTIRGIRRAREVTDEQILNGLMGGDAVDLAALGADEEFRQKLQVYRNYQGDADRRGNKESAKIAAERKKEIIGKAREIWNKALDKQEQFEQLKQAWREELDKGEGLTEGVKDRATARIAGQALFDAGTFAGSVFYQLTGRDATADDLNLTKLAYDAVVDEYAGGSSVEAGARGVGSSLFQGLLFGRLGRAVAGTSVGSQVSAAVAFGKGSRDQSMASASMVPMTDKRRKSHAGNQAAIETGLTLGFGALTSAIGGQTLESILGGGQKIPPIRKAFKTLLGELPEELSITALSDFESKAAGVTPEDAPLIPQLLETAASTIATLGLVESSRRLINFASKKSPSRQDAVDAGLDAFARTASARQSMAEMLRRAEATMRAQVDRADSAAVNLFELAKQTIESQRSAATAAPPTQQAPEAPPAPPAAAATNQQSPADPTTAPPAPPAQQAPPATISPAPAATPPAPAAPAATLQQDQPQPQENPANPASNVAAPPVNVLDDLAARHPEVAEAMAGPTGTPEFSSIREHTAVVLDRYQKSGATTGVPELDAVMPTIIALHDIGKPAAIAAGNKNQQHEMTLPVLERVMRAEGATDQQIAFGKAIVGQDIIGQLVRGQIDIQDAYGQLAISGANAGISHQQFHSIALAMYNADAGSYSRLSHLFDDRGRLKNVDSRVLEEAIHGEVRSIPWTEDYRSGGQGSAGPGSDGGNVYTHSSAYDFTRFDPDKDAGNNLAGPGAYLLPAGHEHIAAVYKRRAKLKMLSIFGPQNRATVEKAIKAGNPRQFDVWIEFLQQRQRDASDPQRAAAYGRAADVLAVFRDNPNGKTLEFKFTPKKTLDLGTRKFGGRALSPVELKALTDAASSFQGGGEAAALMQEISRLGPRAKAWDVYHLMRKGFGYAGANQIVQAAGYDSIGFVHEGNRALRSPRYPVMVALDYSAPVRVQSGLTDPKQTTQVAAGIPIDAKHASELRRLFFSGGNQDGLTRDLVFKRDSIVRKHAAKVQRLTTSLRRAVKRSGQAISDEALNEALADPTKIAQLPIDVGVEVMKIRDHIDALSDQIQVLGGVTPEMFMVIEGNKGSYITRSFRKFDNPEKWRRFALNDPTIMADFAAEVRQHSPNATDQDIRSLAEELLRQSTIAPNSPLVSGSTTQNYVKILKRRTTLSPAVLQLYGENKSIFENYANTVGQMASMVAHRGFISNLVQDGLAAGIFSKKGGPRAQPDHVQEVSHERIPQLAQMKGILMPEELALAIDDLYAMAGTTKLGRIMASGMSTVKALKTVGAVPRAFIRNLAGNIPITIANGNWRILRDWSGPLGGFKDMAMAGRDTFMHDLLERGSQAALDAMERMKELGVIESFRIEEMKDAARAANAGVNRFITGKGKFAKVVGGASRVYAAMDTVSKIQNYRAELATLQRAFPGAPLSSLEERAARIVRATNPTYSEASKAAKWWSRHAPLGSFAMFSAEILRTTGNRNLQMIEELTSGNKVLIAQGLRRMVGQGVAFAGLQALGEQLAAMFGMMIGDDEMDALRDRLPPWQKFSTILVTSKDKDGHPTSYIDLGYNDPFGVITKTARAALTGSSEEAMKQLAEPFVSEDILAGTLLSLWRGRDERGRPIYSEGVSNEEQWRQIGKFIGKKIEPGFSASGRRLWDAYHGGTTSSGIPLKFANELASNLGGGRVETFDREVADYYRNREFDDRVKQSQTALRQTFLAKGTFNRDYARRIYLDAEQTRRETLAEWRKYADGSVKLGEQNVYAKTARDITDESLILKQMYTGKFIPYRFDDEALNAMLKLPQGRERIKLLQELYQQAIGAD